MVKTMIQVINDDANLCKLSMEKSGLWFTIFFHRFCFIAFYLAVPKIGQGTKIIFQIQSLCIQIMHSITVEITTGRD